MKALDIILESLASQGHNSLLLLDIDKTLVEPKNIFIYRKHPEHDEKEVALTPEEFAKDDLAKNRENRKYYDFRDFNDATKVAESIKTGIPLISNLQKMDNYIKNGWKIGVLTARGMEDVVAKTMSEWLKFKDENNNLRSAAARLARNLVFAVNDDSRTYQGMSDFEKKANVIKKMAQKYDRVYLIDDDTKNVNAVNDMAKREGLANKIKAMMAT